MPKKPRTTDGMPARTSIRGLRISRAQLGATSRTNTAVATPRGSAIAIARHRHQDRTQKQRQRTEQVEGRIPTVPKRLPSGTSTNTGTPSRMRKRKIRITKPMLEKPTARIRASTPNSVHRRLGLRLVLVSPTGPPVSAVCVLVVDICAIFSPHRPKTAPAEQTPAPGRCSGLLSGSSRCTHQRPRLARPPCTCTAGGRSDRNHR